jgi:hypothetical protein
MKQVVAEIQQFMHSTLEAEQWECTGVFYYVKYSNDQYRTLLYWPTTAMCTTTQSHSKQLKLVFSVRTMQNETH